MKNYALNDVPDGDEIPDIYDTVWPFFCLNHLVQDPEGCSSWEMDQKKNLRLEFKNKGNALAYIDKKLFQRIGERWKLIPKIDDHCDFGLCQICGEKIVRGYSTDKMLHNGKEITDLYYLLYRCACMDAGKWYRHFVGSYDYHQEHGRYYAAFKKLCPNWIFCKKPILFPGYFNWSYQTYFPFFEQFLIYLEKNPTCSCYWPHCNSSAELISLHAFVKLEGLANNTKLTEEMAEPGKAFSPYLQFFSSEEFVRSLLVHAYFYSNYRRILSDLDQYSFQHFSSDEYQKIHTKLIETENNLLPHFQNLYSRCLKKHPHPKIYYERGMTFFHEGEFLESLEDIRQLIHYAEANHYTELLTSDLYLQEGKLLNEILSYDEAIVSLTKAIQKDPKNKEAYFERAIAFFETGHFSSAVADYKSSGIKPTLMNRKDPLHYIEFSQGMAMGVMKGGLESSVEFVPSLLSSIWGLGKGLWAIVSRPVGISKELIESCKICLEFLKDNSVAEIAAHLIPEIKEYIEKWDQLNDHEKGHFIGHVIGRYGVDIFAWSGCTKAIKAYQSLKRANAILTLENAIYSSKNAEEIAIASKKYFEWREEYKRKCWLHVGQQEKHIPGTNNFIKDRGELLITFEKLETLTKPRLGTGVPTRATFGEASYKETIDFGEIIGNHFSLKTKQKIPTTVGDIHYNKEGGYHIVPVDPNKLQRLIKK